MDPTRVPDAGLTPAWGRACAAHADLAAVLDVVRGVASASAAGIVREGQGCGPIARVGPTDLDWDQCVPPGSRLAGAVELAVPASWRIAGFTRAAWCPLQGADSLVLGWADDDAPAAGTVDLAVWVLEFALARVRADEQLSDLSVRVDNAQRLANMGDYDWHIATDTNRWSDQLYRIFGYEPQSFNASYARFLDHIHPEDRDQVRATHQRAYTTGEPYEMVERIVRPDGAVRFLASNGQVICDEAGAPVRMRGTCIDITERVLAEQGRQRSADLFRGLVEACPDGVVVLDSAGRIVQANVRAAELLGADPVGRVIAEICPSFSGREDLQAVSFDGRPLHLDVNTAALSPGDDEECLLAAFLHDAGPRLHGEALMAALLEAQLRRRQALEINDNIVQGLTAAVLCMQDANPDAATVYLEKTLSAARFMMDDWLTSFDGDDVKPGELVRTLPSTLGDGQFERAAAPDAPDPALPRILVVDDNADVRGLICTQLARAGRYNVVGQAADGEQAVSAARLLQPDVVLLDLSMPRMDGLQALPLVLEAVASARVVVMSGFADASMAEKVLARGAVRYVEKGPRMDLIAVIDGALAQSSGAANGS